MTHSEFKIGGTFWCGGRQWRSTDIGTHTIVAIRLDHVELGSDSPERRRILGRAEAGGRGMVQWTALCRRRERIGRIRHRRLLAGARGNSRINWLVRFGPRAQSEHERYLTGKYAKKPVIATNYPKEIKAFYMRVNDDGRTVAAMDVLALGIGEMIIGDS